jgi:hypothetical protein
MHATIHIDTARELRVLPRPRPDRYRGIERDGRPIVRRNRLTND